MFGLFRRRRSKWEIARDAVVDTIHHALEYVPTDRIEEWRENVVEAAMQGRHTAGDAARGAASTVSAKAGTMAARAGNVAAHAGETAEGARETLSSAIGKLRDSASHLVQTAGHSAHGAAERASHVAGHVAHSSQETAHGALESAQARAESLRDTVSHVEMPYPGKKIRKTKEKMKREAHERMEAAEQRMQHHPEIEVDDGSSKLLWFAVGLLAGAVIAILVAPATGRRSRAVIKDKLDQGKREAAAAASAAGERAADLGRRAAGKVQETIHAAQPDDADDSTIADRIRTELGENPATREFERINVDVVNGVATLRGPIVEAAQNEAIEAVVRGVKGVAEVKMELHIATDPEEDATFVG